MAGIEPLTPKARAQDDPTATFRKLREQVKTPLRPVEIEELAQATALYEGISIESARWYAIGIFHEACGASDDTAPALRKCKRLAQTIRTLAKQAGVA